MAQQTTSDPAATHAGVVAGEVLPGGEASAGGERGAGLVEYALLIALVVLVCVAAITLLGESVAPHYSSAVDGLEP